MKNPTKQEQIDKAYKTYHAIFDPALKAYQSIRDPADRAYRASIDAADRAYEAKVKEINAQPDKVETIITHNGRKYKLVEE